jgi:hypothetical protein
MKKHILFFILAMLPMAAYADDSGSCGDNLTWTFVESTGTLTISGSGEMAYYYSFNYIPWANYKENIKKVIVQDGVTSICNYAFFSCTSLNSITIPNSVTYLGQSIFRECSSLTSITIPDGVTSIWDYSFCGCTGLTSITIPDNVTYISQDAFSGCSNLSSINLPNQLSFIGVAAFQGCSSLTSISLPNSLYEIGNYAFDGCNGLTSIFIPKSVQSIGGGVFASCANLASISVENGNSYFDSRNNCNAIIDSYSNTLVSGCKNTVIPNSVTKIGSSAFEGCSGLTSVTIPNSVTTIENGAFYKCTGLTSLTIPSSVTSIGNYAFSGCNIKSLETHYKTLNNEIISLSSLENLVIGAEVTTITINVSYDCLNLTSIIVESGNPNYDSRNDCNALIETGTNTLLKGCRNSIISDGVIIIGEGAFFECKGLTSINIPNSVTTINRIAFQNCKDVTSIAIGKNVSSIYWGAFAGSSKLTSITVSSENQNYNSKNNCNAIIQTSSNTLIAGCKNTIIPDNVTVIAPCAFMQSGFTSITIPNSVVEIWDMAFAGCSALTSMIIPGNVTKIGYQAFAGCTALESMKVMATTPPVADDYYNDQHHEAFDNYDIPLYVPEASLEDYKKTSPWNKFSSIIAYDKKYQLIYKVDDEVYKTYNFEEGSVITPEPAPTKEGHTFSGWSEIPETMPAHDFVVTGSFTKESYKLIYVVDGAVYKTVSYEFGATITPEAAPTKEGYTFSGWSDIPETMPAKDVTVSGTFAINKYTLTFIVGGNIYENRTLEYGSTIIVPEMPELTGYTFTWGEVPATMPAQNVTIVGEYQPNLYNVTYLINGQFFAIFKLAYGSTITPPEAPERAGSTFTWGDYPETMPAHDITIEGTYTVGINLVQDNQDNQGNQHIEIYTVGGKKVNKMQRGVNIIRRGSKAVKVVR